jgi:prephenate dehydratase
MARVATMSPDRGPGTASRPVGFLGPAGTFTEQALLSQADLTSRERRPYPTVPDVLDAVTSGEVDVGLVPIENSIEGMVNFTQDALAFDYDLQIQREVVLDVRHCLLVAPGGRIRDIDTVVSIPVAIAQCHAFLRRELRSAEIRAANSTADAARQVAVHAAGGGRTWAAIAPAASADIHGLTVITEQIADHENNQTRFVLVGRDAVPAPTGHDRTAIVVYQRADEPGSLISILQEFAARRINLSHLSSRPTKHGGLGDYCFVIYCDGHVADELVADALRALRVRQGSVKFLGSYPAAGDQAHGAREHADARWRDADDWIAGVRRRVTRRD